MNVHQVSHLGDDTPQYVGFLRELHSSVSPARAIDAGVPECGPCESLTWVETSRSGMDWLNVRKVVTC